jgi:hypothetical protein
MENKEETSTECLNPDDCGSNGLPSSLCKNCGEAFRRDMEDRNGNTETL